MQQFIPFLHVLHFNQGFHKSTSKGGHGLRWVQIFIILVIIAF